MLTRLFNEFFNSEKAGGIILVIAAFVSMVLANSYWQSSYTQIWKVQFAGHNLAHWINDGLMTLFFLLIGLELEREIYQGELSGLRNASLPIFGAIGGMLVPAAIFIFINYGSSASSGAGIPMATDIAFAIGILSLLGSRVPPSLKIFLTALAVIDDLGAILVIALFYSAEISILNLSLAIGIFIVLLILNRFKVHGLLFYILGGVAMWYFMLHSGIHATITGVLLAFAIPFGDGSESSPSYRLQHFLHKPAAFIILPLFAMANTCIVLYASSLSGLSHPGSVGILMGLIIGKPLGILLFTFTGVFLGFCTLPAGIKWKNILGVGMLAGIGFTMSVFITLLAYTDPGIIDLSKIAIILASCISGIAGYSFLKYSLRNSHNH